MSWTHASSISLRLACCRSSTPKAGARLHVQTNSVRLRNRYRAAAAERHAADWRVAPPGRRSHAGPGDRSRLDRRHRPLPLAPPPTRARRRRRRECSHDLPVPRSTAVAGRAAGVDRRLPDRPTGPASLRAALQQRRPARVGGAGPPRLAAPRRPCGPRAGPGDIDPGLRPTGPRRQGAAPAGDGDPRPRHVGRRWAPPTWRRRVSSPRNRRRASSSVAWARASRSG